MKKSVVVVALATFCFAGSVQAQPYGLGGGPGWGSRMMGPGMMGGSGYGRMCDRNVGGFADWRVERLERLLKPTDVQREAFQAFKTASLEASKTLRDSCPAAYGSTAPARMEIVEKRMEVMLQAVKAVRPKLEALYATLSAEQKLLFDDDSYRRRIWRSRWRE